jgi:hypothetical protein
MLRTMQSLAEHASPPNSQNFAGFLAEFAKKPPKSLNAFADEQLADDVVSLSYERALRAHARSRVPHSIESDVPVDPSPQEETGEQEPHGPEAFSSASDGITEERPAPAATAPGSRASTSASSEAASNRALKSASITIRLSRDECAQLHRRASEAGLTVSAYLRSCTFEAETLRALVKQTMAQLKSNQAQEEPAQQRKGRGTGLSWPTWLSWLNWLKGLWPKSRAHRGALEA